MPFLKDLPTLSQSIANLMQSAHHGASTKEAKQDSSANATEAASATLADKSHRLNQGVTGGESGPALPKKPEQERQRTAGETATLSKFPVKQKVDSAAAAKKPAVKKTLESLSCTQRVQMLVPSRVKHSNSGMPKSPDKHKVLGAGTTAKAGKSLETSTHQGTPGSVPQSLRSPGKKVSADPSRSPEKAFVQSTPPSRLPANPERLDPSQRKRKDYRHPGQPSFPVSRQSSSPVLHSLSNKASAKKPLKAQSSSPALPTRQASKASPYSSSGREMGALRGTPGSRNKPKMASALASQARKPAQESADSLRHLSGKPGPGSHAAAAAKVAKGSDAHFDSTAFIPIGVAEEEADEEKLNLAVTENLSDELVFSSTRHASAVSRDADLTFVTNECREISSSSALSQSSSTVSGLSLTTASDKEKTVFPHHPAADSQAQKQIIDISRKGRAMNSAAPKAKDPDDRPAGNLPVETLSDEELMQNGSLGAVEALLAEGVDTGGWSESTVGCVAVKPSLSHLSLQVESTAALCTTTAGPSCPNQVTDAVFSCMKSLTFRFAPVPLACVHAVGFLCGELFEPSCVGVWREFCKTAPGGCRLQSLLLVCGTCPQGSSRDESLGIFVTIRSCWSCRYRGWGRPVAKLLNSGLTSDSFLIS